MVQIQYNYGVMMKKAIIKVPQVRQILSENIRDIMSVIRERVENVDFVEF